MKNQDKKELHFFRRFRKLNSLLDNRYFEKSETPDFITKDHHKPVIGVEITDLVSKKEIKNIPVIEIYSLERKLVKKAENLFMKKYNLPLHVSFDFVPGIRIASNQFNAISNEMAGIIWYMVKDAELSDYFDITQEYPLPDYLKYVSASYFPNIADSVWYNGYAEFVPDISVEDIQTVLDKKEQKIGTYRKNVDMIYLLIIEGLLPSWHGSIETVSNHKYSCSFDGVFVLRSFQNKLYELRITSNN